MITQSQPTNPVNTANPSHPAIPSNPAKAAEHFAWIPARHLSALVPFGEGEELQIAAIHFDGYASFGYYAPQPNRDDGRFEDLEYPYRRQYNDSGLNQASEFRMRQAYDLQLRLSADASEFWVAPPDTYPKAVRLTFEQLAARRNWIERKRDALVHQQKLQISRLHQLVELTQVLFERLRLTEPSGMSTTPFAPESIALMKKASFEIPEEMNPLGLYQAICRRLLLQEEEVAAVGLEILRDEIQLVRMGLYAETGLFLRAQAQTVMAEYHLPENALLIDTEDEIYQHLEEVVENPVNTYWPFTEQPDISDDLDDCS